MSIQTKYTVCPKVEQGLCILELLNKSSFDTAAQQEKLHLVFTSLRSTNHVPKCLFANKNMTETDTG